MTEVRVHAAFKVKDEATFLKEAAKVVEATQVKLDIFLDALASLKPVVSLSQ